MGVWRRPRTEGLLAIKEENLRFVQRHFQTHFSYPPHHLGHRNLCSRGGHPVSSSATTKYCPRSRQDCSRRGRWWGLRMRDSTTPNRESIPMKIHRIWLSKPICVFYGSVSEIVTQHFPGERRVLRAIPAISSTHTASMSMRLEYV